MPSPRELKRVIGGVGPELLRLGFKRFGTTFNREAEHVIGFQASQSGDRFTVNLGVYVREVDALLHDWWGRSGKSGTPGRDSAVREVHNQAATLSTMIAEKIIRRSLNASDQADLVRESLEQLQTVGR